MERHVEAVALCQQLDQLVGNPLAAQSLLSIMLVT